MTSTEQLCKDIETKVLCTKAGNMPEICTEREARFVDFGFIDSTKLLDCHPTQNRAVEFGHSYHLVKLFPLRTAATLNRQ